MCALIQSGGATHCDEDCYDDDSLSDEVDSDDLDDLYDEDEDEDDEEDDLEDDVVEDEVVVKSGRAVARRSTRRDILRSCDWYLTRVFA